MVKSVTVVLLCIIAMAACTSARKVQGTTAVVTKVDTATVTPIADTTASDSSQFIRDVFNKALVNKINFKTFTARVKVEYKAGNDGEDATAYIRIQRDSLIWLSLRGALGIEGARVLISKDSVKVLNMLQNTIMTTSINYLQHLTGLPLDFTSVQDIIVGNAAFADSNIITHSINENKELNLTMIGVVFIHYATLDKDYKLLHSKLEDVYTSSGRTVEIFYNGYNNSAGVPFSTVRKINISGQQQIEINMEFKSWTFNEGVTFPFNIPENFKRL